MLHSFGHRVRYNNVERAHEHLTLRVSVSVAMIYCIYLLRALPGECSSYSMTDEQSFESINDESLIKKMRSLYREKGQRSK